MKFTKEKRKFVKMARTVGTLHTHTHIVLEVRKVAQDLRLKFIR